MDQTIHETLNIFAKLQKDVFTLSFFGAGKHLFCSVKTAVKTIRDFIRSEPVHKKTTLVTS